MRETSILFAAGIAAFVLKERFGPVKTLASLAVVAGIGLMHWPQRLGG
jgi:drug/metabolite transporter (DMT)-like permease